ncbi:MAG: tetratricopeptide repeat protein, partial [Flavobacteriales bacterium]
ITLQNEERWFEAIHYLKKALEQDADNAEIWFAIGDAEYHLENFQNAETAYRKVIELDQDNIDIWLEYSHLLVVDDRPEEAISLMQEAMQRHPEENEYEYRLACYLYGAGKIQEAYQVIASALDKNPDLAYTMFDYSASLKNDQRIIDLIEQYKNKG